jgi:hypothetical protein
VESIKRFQNHLNRRLLFMKKFSLIISLSMLLIITGGCGKQVFDGSRTGNDTQFIMEYSVLNRTETHEMKLEEGTNINVKLVNESGRLKILVTDPDGQEIYSGDRADSSEFSLKATKTGTYKFSVTGNKAKGSVSFIAAD